MIINISNKPNIYGQVGRRVEYTGDMANPAGVGAIVAINEPTRFSPLTADVLLEDGRAIRVGKKRAGRLLDGVTHDGYPEGGA